LTTLVIPLGLQLHSLRHELTNDVPGVLASVRALGITDVETASLHGLSPADFASALRNAGLACRSALFPYDRFRDEAEHVMRDAHTLGARFVVCAWMPHEGRLTREECLRAADVYERAGRVARRQDLRFAYHIHGFELEEAAPEGTLFDTLATHTSADAVAFEIDVFWARAGGADPAALIDRLAGRVPLTHLKDMERGLDGPPRGDRARTANVALGTGSLDFPSILAASERAGVELQLIEDEHPEARAHLPHSLAYLRGLRGAGAA
jgi:sugar phosphate isomerase/epimerase